MATYYPHDLECELVNSDLSLENLILATEMIGQVKDAKLATRMISQQLDHPSQQVQEATVWAMRCLTVRYPELRFSLNIRGKLERIDPELVNEFEFSDEKAS